jgi:hypothetical protein
MKKKQRRRTERYYYTTAGVPHLSNATEVAGHEPDDEEATTKEVYQLAAIIKARGLELTRKRSVLDTVNTDAEDWMDPD